jgi:hypothetical protein
VKTTIDLPDELLIEAKKLAVDRRTTLRELVEAGLRRELAERTAPRSPWKVQPWVETPGTVTQAEIDDQIGRARDGRSFPEFGQPVE